MLELILSVADLVSDFLSGSSLLSEDETYVWGIGSFVINWIPGIVGAIQIISDYRKNPTAVFTTVVVYCLASLILCPLVPTLTVIYLLFSGPKNSEERESQEFYDRYCKLLSFATIVRALEGCLESSLQISYKFFLMFHGVVTFDFTSVTLIKDAFGNKLPVPFILNFVIAILALIKAVATLNIDNLARPSKQLLLSLIPFLISCTFFKLGAIAMLFGYLSIYAILLVTLILMVGFYINDCTLEDQEHIPRWLISVTNLFVPLCFTTKRNQDINKVQEKNLKYQTINCFGFYGTGLIILGILVNLSKLNMNPDLPINSIKFNIILTSVMAFGLLALLISFNLKLRFKKKIFNVIVLAGQNILLFIILVTSFVWLLNAPNDDAFIAFKTNNTHLEIIQAKEIIPLQNKSIINSEKIVIVKSSDLLLSMKSFRNDNPDVIIILLQDEFKPSSPLSWSLNGLDGSIPTLLVRKENAKEISEFENHPQEHIELTKKVDFQRYGFYNTGNFNIIQHNN